MTLHKKWTLNYNEGCYLKFTLSIAHNSIENHGNASIYPTKTGNEKNNIILTKHKHIVRM
jgi:hypothetical protein